MARRRGRRSRRGGSRKQGFVSWIVNVIALLIGLGPVWKELAFGVQSGDWSGRVDNLNRFYNPLAGDQASLKLAYGSLAGGIIFKVAAGELAKRARMKSLIPALHA